MSVTLSLAAKLPLPDLRPGISKEQTKAEIANQLKKGQEIRESADSYLSSKELESLRKDTSKWVAYVADLLNARFATPAAAQEFNPPPGFQLYGGHSEQVVALRESLDDYVFRLDSICDRVDHVFESPVVAVRRPSSVERSQSDFQIHPLVEKVTAELLKSGHESQAVFEACKLLEQIVKERTGIDKIGKALMAEAFNPKAPRILLNDLSSQNDFDEQEGFMHLYIGTMQGIRNPKGHSLAKNNDPSQTIEQLALVSMLVRRAENGRVVEPQKKIASVSPAPSGQKVANVEIVQANSPLFQRVLSPLYTTIFNIDEQLRRMSDEGADSNFQTHSLKQIESELLYRKLDPPLRKDIGTLMDLVSKLNEEKEVGSSIATMIENSVASKMFNLHAASVVRLWYHRGIVTDPVEGRPIWLWVLVGKNPLQGANSDRVQSLEIGNNQGMSIKIPLFTNPIKFEEFWTEVIKAAAASRETSSFREHLQQSLELSRKILNTISDSMEEQTQ